MDIAIVTGADTPLGIHLIEDLIRQGCRVHGIGNNFSNVTFADPHFIAHAIDLSDLEAITHTAAAIIEKEKAIHILIHAIDVTPGTAFEQLPIGNLEAILKVGLLGPVMLTRILLPNLLRFRGQLINIIPTNKNGHDKSAVNALIEGGLREMSNALFDQARDAGLRVTNLILRQNTVSDDTDFADKKVQTRIDSKHIACTVQQLLDPNQPNVPNEIILHPRLSGAAKEALPSTTLPIDPYDTVVLPPKEYFPKKQETIPTKKPDRIDRTIPYTDEEIEEKIAAAIQDYESQPKRDEELKKNNKNKRQNQRSNRQSKDLRPKTNNRPDSSKSSDSTQNTEDSSKLSEQSKSKRGRRRGGRNRNQKGAKSIADANQKKSSVDNKIQTTSTPKKNTTEKRPQPGHNRNQKPVARSDKKYANHEQESTVIREDSLINSEQPNDPPKSEKITARKTKSEQPASSEQTQPLTKGITAKKKAAKKATKKIAAKKKVAKKKTTPKAKIPDPQGETSVSTQISSHSEDQSTSQ